MNRRRSVHGATSEQLPLLRPPSRKSKKGPAPTILDMFSGVGGLSLGFDQAGFRTLAGIDHDTSALNTFSRNHEGALPLELDLSGSRWLKEVSVAVGKQRVDVIVGGPPCQGFSLTGPRKLTDPRNNLYMSVLRAVDHFKPKAFVIENVLGMASLYKGMVLRDVLSHVQSIGYFAESKVLLAADYGVPQLRRRLFIVGVRKQQGFPFAFPSPTRTPESYVTCEQAIGDLPALEDPDSLGEEMSDYDKPSQSAYQRVMRKGSRHLWNHVATRHTELVRSVISQVPEGGDYRDLPPGVGTSRTFNEAWTRYHSQRPSHTIDTGHRNHFHYRYNRVPTVRENARLQSFPDSFIFHGTKTAQNRQVGNAVPPLLGRAIATQLLDYL